MFLLLNILILKKNSTDRSNLPSLKNKLGLSCMTLSKKIDLSLISICFIKLILVSVLVSWSVWIFEQILVSVLTMCMMNKQFEFGHRKNANIFFGWIRFHTAWKFNFLSVCLVSMLDEIRSPILKYLRQESLANIEILAINCKTWQSRTFH